MHLNRLCSGSAWTSPSYWVAGQTCQSPEKAAKILDGFDVKYQIRVASALRSPKYLEDIVETAENDGCHVIGMAGVAAALPKSSPR